MRCCQGIVITGVFIIIPLLLNTRDNEQDSQRPPETFAEPAVLNSSISIAELQAQTVEIGYQIECLEHSIKQKFK